MNKEQIIALSNEYPLNISGYAKSIEKINASTQPLFEVKSDVSECQNHLDDDFMAFLQAGGHLDLQAIPLSI